MNVLRTALNHADYLVRRTIYDLTRPVFIKQMAWVLLLWGLLIITALHNIRFMKTRYPKPPRPDDLILDLFKGSDSFITFAAIAGSLGTFLIVYIMWREGFKRVPKLLFLLVIMYFIRAFTIPLTPLAQIRDPAATYAESNIIAQNFYHGMFFSGHTASAFIQVFFIKGHPMRPVAAAIAVIQVIALLGSHSHYSIDIFGGFFVAYFVAHFDFMRLVPRRLHTVRWMPWYVGEQTAFRTRAGQAQQPEEETEEEEEALQPVIF